VLQLRKQLTDAGLDAGADTIGWHLSHHHQLTLSRATINRILIRHGAVTPDPAKRPKSSYIRFEPSSRTRPGNPTSPTTDSLTPTADQAQDCEIITWLDDHSRYALHISAMSGSAPRSSCRPSAKPQVSTAFPHPHSPITGWSTPSGSPAAPADATTSSTSYAA
jgi:hypothetical protein